MHMFKWSGLFVILALTGCELDNQVASDEVFYGTAVAGGAEFQSARTVLAASCMRCHTAWKDYSENDFVSEGSLVVAGNPAGSELFRELRGAGYDGSMPPYYQLEDSQIAVIKSWIESLATR